MRQACRHCPPLVWELRQAFDETRDDPTSRSPLTQAGQTVDEQDDLKR
jgi:hypothetical protein